MRTLLLILIGLTATVLSCKSEKQKEKARADKEATEIFSDALSKAKTKGFPLNYDSLMTAFAEKSNNDPNEALEYAKKFQKSVLMVEYTPERDVAADTAKYFELRLAKIWKESDATYLKFEVKNLTDKTVDNFWFEVSLKDKDGEYLQGKESVHIDNVRPGGVGIEDRAYFDIISNQISEIILEPYRLEVDGTKYPFDPNQVRILDNNYGIKMSF